MRVVVQPFKSIETDCIARASSRSWPVVHRAASSVAVRGARDFQPLNKLGHDTEFIDNSRVIRIPIDVPLAA